MAANDGILKQIGRFDGSNWEEFCIRFEKACALASKEPKDMIIFHVSDDIYRAIKRQAEAENSTWDSIKSAFKALYGKVVDKSAILREFHSRMQGPTEPVHAYLIALRTVESDFAPALPEAEFLSKFVSGLRPDTRRAVKIQQTNLDTADKVLEFVREIEAEPKLGSSATLLPVTSVVANPVQSTTASQPPAVHAVKAHGPSTHNSKSAAKASIKCHHCGKLGHMKRDCLAWFRELREREEQKQLKPQHGSKSFAAKVRAVRAVLDELDVDDE